VTNQDFTCRFLVDQTPEHVFKAICNVRGWWSAQIDGHTDALGAVFQYRYRDRHRCTIKIVELLSGQRVVWQVLDNYFPFTRDNTEWTGTTIHFAIASKDGRTEVRFTHEGLTPQYECYDICSDGWSRYINGSLHQLITTGKGQPNVREAITARAAAPA
jgi:hypothetical protein